MYLPGEEIKIDTSTAFNNYLFDGDPLTTVKNRVAFATLLFIFAYLVITVRLFGVCLSNGLPAAADDEESRHLFTYADNPIKRADILDRNGTIIATSLPTVNLYANPRKVPNKKKLPPSSVPYCRTFAMKIFWLNCSAATLLFT